MWLYVCVMYSTFEADDVCWKLIRATTACVCQIATESVRTVVEVVTPWKSMKLRDVVENSMHSTRMLLPETVPVLDASKIAPRISALHGPYPFGDVLQEVPLKKGIRVNHTVDDNRRVAPCMSSSSIRFVFADTTVNCDPEMYSEDAAFITVVSVRMKETYVVLGGLPVVEYVNGDDSREMCCPDIVAPAVFSCTTAALALAVATLIAVDAIDIRPLLCAPLIESVPAPPDVIDDDVDVIVRLAAPPLKMNPVLPADTTTDVRKTLFGVVTVPTCPLTYTLLAALPARRVLDVASSTR